MRNIVTAFILSLAVMSCGSDSGGEDNPGGGGGSNQEPAALVFPQNNSECTTGVDLSDTHSKITFQWATAPETETYFLYVKNLLTQSTLQYNASSNTSYELTLQKGTPYSWYVAAKKAGGATIASPTWKFYNAGAGITNYAPFPAEAVAPEMSTTVYGPTITLEWSGSDADSDIADYKIYLGTTNNPSTLIGTVTSQTLPNVAVVSGGTYYWKIVTTDQAGNVTTSPVYQFKVF